jgi:methyltransferase (TIGR00027 family)
MNAAIHNVALTAFYCCVLRANDALSSRPVCGDSYAARFVDDRIRAQMTPLVRFAAPAASNVARHRLIDDVLRDALHRDPSRRVLLLGAGFDTRAFRLAGGRWWEFDDPALLAFKEEKLPARSAPNVVVRHPIDFSRDPLADHLAPLAGHDTAYVVLEGVSMYLPYDVLVRVASAVRAFLPRARLVADLMSPAFRRRYSEGLRRELAKLGAQFAKTDEHPRSAIEAVGYRACDVRSIVGRAVEAGSLPLPAWILDIFLRELRDGYAVFTFEPPP